MLAKNTTSKRLNNIDGLHNVNYGNRYHYSNTDNPYAVRKIENTMTGKVDHYDWDAKGNMIEHFAEDTEQLRRLCWTEDNRLQAFMETEGQSAYYNYTASGERNLKFTGTTATIHQNGNEYHKPVLTEPTLYASSLMTITRKGYTKHIFEEGKRICSKIGGGFTNTTLTELNIKVPKVKHDYEEQFYIQRDGITKGFETCMSVTPEIQGDDLYKVIANHQLGVNNTEPAFYYHSDHLGSASYVTASNGAVVQMLNYLPYGEDWVDLQNFNAMPQVYNMGVYKYNGKEKDAETGYHYYGARYYDSEKIGWLSVDPLADKYPSLSNYVYCSNNPIRLVDPNGMDEFKFDESGNFKGKTEAKHDIVRIVDGDGNIIAETRQFPLGTIKHEKTKYKYYDQLSNPEYNIDAFEVKGSDVGEELFIFFAENITAKNDIEYSRFIFEDGLNTVSTSHLIDRDVSHAYIYEKYCKQPTSRKAIQHDHSHGNTFKLSDSDLKWRSFLEKHANPEIITMVFCKGEFKTYDQNGYEN